MSEQKIPTEMLDAVRPIAERMSESSLTPGYDGGCSGLSEDEAMGWLEAALQAAGVPALRERIAKLEAALDLARMQAADNTALTEKAAKYAASKDARIAELEAELGEVNLIAEARSVVGMDLLAEADRQDARIAELEATNIKLRAEIEMLETENAALEDELSEYWQ